MRKLWLKGISFLLVLILCACSKETTSPEIIPPEVEPILKVEYFLVDSEGEQQDTFVIGDDMYLRFIVTNNTEDDIEYTQISYIEQLVDYAIFETANYGEYESIGLPPPGSDCYIDKILSTGGFIESTDPIPVNGVGEYSMCICPLITFYREELSYASQFRIDFIVVEDK